MAHFAELDASSFVSRVVVISNEDLLDKNGVEQESIGITVCKDIFGAQTRWIQTSYNRTFRKKFAQVGDRYDHSADVFYNPNPPFPSWSLNASFDWQPPVPMPTDGGHYMWDEGSLSWVSIPTGDE